MPRAHCAGGILKRGFHSEKHQTFSVHNMSEKSHGYRDVLVVEKIRFQSTRKLKALAGVFNFLRFAFPKVPFS